MIDRHLATRADHGPVDVYRFVKRMTLDLAAEVFLGAGLGTRADRVNRAFSDAIGAAVTPLRLDLLGTRYGRGLRGRRWLQRFFAEEIDRRRTPTCSSRSVAVPTRASATTSRGW